MTKHPDPPQRILFLYLKTGGGHLSAANALVHSIQERRSGEAETFMLDPVPDDDRISNLLLQDGYRYTSHIMKPVWIFLYEISRFKLADYFWSAAMYLVIRKKLFSFFEHEQIDKVIILHFLLIRPVTWVLKKLKNRPSVLTIITDPFTAHNLWFGKKDMDMVVFSKRLRLEALSKYKFSPGRVRQFPLILKRVFEAPLCASDIRAFKASKGLASGKKLILFAGGGEGFPKALQYIQALLDSDVDAEIAVVCGKDKSLYQRLVRLKMDKQADALSVFGFIDYMFELMNAADIIVSKGGPATIMEALMLQKPLIITQYLYGQEKGNVEFVVNNGVGFYTPEPESMVSAIRGFFDGDGETSSGKIRNNIMNLTIENGTDRIADYILERMKPAPRKA